MQLNLQTLNLIILNYIKDSLTCFVYYLIKILKNKKLRYLIFEKYFF